MLSGQIAFRLAPFACAVGDSGPYSFPFRALRGSRATGHETNFESADQAAPVFYVNIVHRFRIKIDKARA